MEEYTRLYVIILELCVILTELSFGHKAIPFGFTGLARIEATMGTAVLLQCMIY